MSEHLRTAREAYERRSWRDAYDAYVRAEQSASLAGDDLERLAISSFLTGHDLEFGKYLERLHRLHVGAGDAERAARCAYWLGLSLMFRGEIGQTNAWLARGQRLVEGHDCAERGYLLVPVAEQQLRGGALEAAHATAADAAAIGERFGDTELTAVARHVQGRSLIRQGSVPAGLVLLDETMLAVLAGDLSPITTGLMYCSVIGTCQEVYAWSRAREWTLALSRWCDQQSDTVAFIGTCLVHRAEILQFHGSWRDALMEAHRACECSENLERKPPARAFYQQAEIHRLRGEFSEAEEAYRAASRLGCDPHPGLALLRMAQGRIDAACASITRLVSVTTDRMQRARLLPAHLDIMLARGDTGEASRACRELEELAEFLDSDVLRATAVRAQGAIALAQGDVRTALGQLRSAFEWWQRLDAPYDSARVRVLIARACHALDDDEAAALEIDAARIAFEQLEARPDLAGLHTVASGAAPADVNPLTARERDVLRLVAAGHTNKEIASFLSLSERTIDRHVGNILNKLDVPSRTAATTYAHVHKLL
jgi:DNA-binding CsgD family transcriptional regulator